MEGMIGHIFLHHWQRKIVAVLTAVIVWFAVHNSISTTRVIPSVPIRIVNLASNKTIPGLLPNGLLTKRISVTLTGDKDILGSIGTNDLEVIVDASGMPDFFTPKIGRKNVVSTNPEIDLFHNVTRVSATDFSIKMSRLITAQIPVVVLPPVGEAPKGYQFLDVWPQKLYHTVSGPEEEIEELRTRGLELVFDLNAVTAWELDELGRSQEDLQTDEISYMVPSRWKQVAIPCLNNELQEISDPDAQGLRIDFLKNDLLPLDHELPVTVFYPVGTSGTLNPTTAPLAAGEVIQDYNGVTRLAIPCYLRDVSRLFVELVREHLAVTIMASSDVTSQELPWCVQLLDTKKLEDQYVQWLLPGHTLGKMNLEQPSHRENYLRHRFREYAQRLQLFTGSGQRLDLVAELSQGAITLRELSVPDES